MASAKETDAIIIDVRDNGGGTRDLIQELYDDINYVDLLSSAEYFAGYERGQ